MSKKVKTAASESLLKVDQRSKKLPEELSAPRDGGERSIFSNKESKTRHWSSDCISVCKSSESNCPRLGQVDKDGGAPQGCAGSEANFELRRI